MDEAEFWTLIETTKGDAKHVQAALSNLPEEDIDAWDRIYWVRHNALHRWDVWGAAYVINGGCSDDSFHYFKAFAIGNGKAFYGALVTNPDSVGPLITEDDLEDGCDNEGLNYVSAEILGEEALPSRSMEGERPAGDPWEEDDLPIRFPRLTARFG